MADYFTQTYFRFNANEQEVNVLREIDEYHDGVNGDTVKPSDHFMTVFPSDSNDKLKGFRRFLEEEDFDHEEVFSDELDYEFGQAVYASHDVRLTYISVILQRVCKSALPITFQWAVTCSSFRDEDFGGGYTIIEESGITGGSSMDDLEAARERLAAA